MTCPNPPIGDPKRGDRVAPPAGTDEWELRFATAEAAKGWEELCRQAAGNTLVAWNDMRTRADTPSPTPRHHQLKGSLSVALDAGVEMEQWQIEVTGSGRIWSLVDTARRTLWIKAATTGHPKITE